MTAVAISAPPDIDHGTLETLVLLLTWRCPAACDHCVFESGPDNKVDLDIEAAKAAVDAAARLSPRPSLSFSGGEPFAAREAMNQLLQRAWAYGMASEIVTSCAWVADARRTRQILEEMQSNGLQVLCVSFDRFHTPFVASWKVAMAIASAVDLGLHVVVNVLEEEFDARDHDRLADALDLDRDQLRAVRIHPQRVNDVGRARKTGSADRSCTTSFRGGCSRAGRFPTITPDGLLFPCCGPVVGEQAPGRKLFEIGALETADSDTVSEAFEALDDDLMVRLLSRMGPLGIIQMAQGASGAHSQAEYVNQCDICLTIAADAALNHEVAELLAHIDSLV